MAKLSQLLMLEQMLHTCDNMKTKDAWIIEYQGRYILQLVDSINVTLVRHLNSKTLMSCRNVVVANSDTFKKTTHWLKCKLFGELPKEMGNALREKIEQMVDLLNALMLKIFDVEPEFTDKLIERMKNIYMKNTHATDYELWKRRHPKLTMERLTEYQAELTADMLIMGVLKHDDEPSGQEIEDVDMEKLRKKLKKGKALPDGFETECAKLRRYSYWDGKMFMIDFEQFVNYIIRVYSLLTCEQRKAMYEYKVQMTQIHEDMRKLMKENEEDELKEEMEMKEKATEETQPEDNDKGTLCSIIRKLHEENVLKKMGDWGLLMTAINQTDGLPYFDTPNSFITYLSDSQQLDGIELPSESSISKMVRKMRGMFPDWTFTDTSDVMEVNRRINVGRRLFSAARAAKLI